MSGTCFANAKYGFFKSCYVKFQLITCFLECALSARESNFGIYIRSHSFSTFARFSEKLTFLTR